MYCIPESVWHIRLMLSEYVKMPMNSLLYLQLILHVLNILIKSSIYTPHNIGDKTPPCLTPLSILQGTHNILFHLICICCLAYMFIINLNTVGHNLISFSKIRVGFNNAYRRIFGLSNRISASAMYANYNIHNFEAI